MDGTGSKQQRVCFGSSFSMLSHVWRQQRAGNVSDFTGLPRTANEQRAKEEHYPRRKSSWKVYKRFFCRCSREESRVAVILSSWAEVSMINV